jgi:dephospho-CoA kinase
VSEQRRNSDVRITGSAETPRAEQSAMETIRNPQSAIRNGDNPQSAIQPLVVGILGGIGSGKSAVAAEFARRGARVIPADQIGHEALRQEHMRREVVRRWGPEMLDANGEISRRKLGAIVFNDPRERKALEELVHPWIRARIEEEVARAKADPAVPLIVLDAAVLMEAGWHDVCDRLVYVDAPRKVRLERVSRQRGWATRELEDRERAQLALTEKRVLSHHVLDNSSTLEHLHRQIDELMHRWERSVANASSSLSPSSVMLANPIAPTAGAFRDPDAC